MSKLSLRESQIGDLAFMIANPRCGLLHDPGVGKTPPVCVYIEYLWTEHHTKTYWVMPKSLLVKNKDELLNFTNLSEKEIVIVDGTPKQRKEQMGSKDAKVFLMGFKRFSDDWKNLKDLHPELGHVCVDEIHMGFKSHSSTRTKELFKCMRVCKYFTAMSGTLIDGRLDSCYPTIHIIEPRYYVNHTSFLAQHAIMDEYGTVVAWTNHAKLGFIFQRHCIRRTFSSEYGDEEKVIHKQPCAMSPSQLKAYKKFEAEAILELEDKFITAGSPAVAAIRCRQIMAHPETMGLLEDGEKTGKDEALMVHIEDHINKKEPILIYASLQPEQERIAKLCTSMGLRTGLINGNVPAPERADIDLKFREGKLDAVVASPATAAVGFNWGHVNHVVFASLDYQNVNFVQAYRRAIRGKRKTPLWITILEYEKSIDQRIFDIVNKKSKDLSKVDSSYEELDLGSKENLKNSLTDL